MPYEDPENIENIDYTEEIKDEYVFVSKPLRELDVDDTDRIV